MIKIAFTCSMEDSRFFLKSRYIDYLSSGAEYCGTDVLPVILPASDDLSSAVRYASEFDGFIFTGGGDIEPWRYGMEDDGLSYDTDAVRDSFELTLLDEIKRIGKPALGICRGIQVMAVSCGGRLITDIDRSVHVIGDRHRVRLTGDGRGIIGCGEIITNSYHHQSVGYAGDGVTVEGISEDGGIEMISRGGSYFRAVQWHPEIAPDLNSMKLIASFLHGFEGRY